MSHPLTSRLSLRDLHILDTITSHGQATSSQLLRLHFADGATTSQGARQRRTMARLAKWGFVSRTRLAIGGPNSGSAGYLYQAATRTPKPIDLHALAITELRIRLVEAQRLRLIELADFTPEPDSHFRIGSVDVRPDATARIGIAGQYRRCFLELDRDTESAAEIRRKLDAYADARNVWPDNETFPLAVFVVTHPLPHREEKRVMRLGRLIAEHHSSHLFAVCPFDRIVSTLVS